MKGLLGAGLVALCTMLTACAGSGSSVSTDGGVTGAFLPPQSSDGGAIGIPRLISLTPANPFPGDFITVLGENFGSSQLDTSKFFFSADGTTTTLDAGAVERTADWTSTSIRIKVPSAAVTGPIQVVLASRTQSERRSNVINVTVKRAFDPNAAPKVVFINPARAQFVGADTPVTIVFDRPILAATMNVSAVSFAEVAIPDESLKTDEFENTQPCDLPFVCDLRTEDLIKCSCSTARSALAPVDISATLRATAGTAWTIGHTRFAGKTVVISINNSVKADGAVDQDGNTRNPPGPDIPSLGELFFFFVN